MSHKLLIGQHMAALLEDGRPVEIYPVPENVADPVGAIHLARVKSVFGATSSALLTLETGGEAFLPIKSGKKQLAEGAAILVQIKKPASPVKNKWPTANKRAEATTSLHLVGRTLVVRPSGSGMIFSKRVDWSRQESSIRDLLRRIANDASVVIRTAATETTAENIRREAQDLIAQWQKITSVEADAPALLMSAPQTIERLIRDHAPPDGDILIDDPAVFAGARKIVRQKWPWLTDRLCRWKKPEGLFEAFDVSDAIERALSDRIDLPSGGWIRIEATEGLTAIDVNSGGAGAGRNASAMRLAVNREAAREIADQLRLQNIGGLIVVDFLNMTGGKDRDDLLKAFDQALAEDIKPVERTEISRFGLVELSRKRSGPSLKEWMKS